jgi:hypothetical protein
MKQFEAKVQNSCFKKEIEYLSITNINKFRSCESTSQTQAPYGLWLVPAGKTLSIRKR